MYPEPQEEYLYLDEDYPYLACYVDYEITYMSDEILVRGISGSLF